MSKKRETVGPSPQAGLKYREMPDVGLIIAYEDGSLSEEGVLKLFQSLVDSGMAWKLQGHYGHTASVLLDAGLITRRR